MKIINRRMATDSLIYFSASPWLHNIYDREVEFGVNPQTKGEVNKQPRRTINLQQRPVLWKRCALTLTVISFMNIKRRKNKALKIKVLNARRFVAPNINKLRFKCETLEKYYSNLYDKH
jgi:hypothetical protein